MDELICDGCGALPLHRRAFLSRSALGAIALALAACSGDDSTAPELTNSSSIKITDHPELASVNGVAILSLNGSPIAVVRTGAASFIALSRVCPHQGATVGVSGNGFKCPRHGATFNATGTWIGGQQTSNMRSYSTSFNAATNILTIG